MERRIFGNQHFNRWSAEGFLNCMNDCGIRAVELCPYASWLDIADQEDIFRFRKILDMADISAEVLMIEQGGVVPFNLALELKDVESWSLNYAEKVLHNMPALGAEKLVLSAGRQSLDHKREDGWKRSLRNIHRIGRLAQEDGVQLLLCSDGTDHFSNIVRTTDELIQMLQEIDLPNVKAYADLVSIMAAGENFEKSIQNLYTKGLLGHVCISDGPAGWLLPGEGTIGADGVKNARLVVQKIGYEGTITYRLQHWKYDFSPDQATQKLNDFWNGVF